MEPKIHRADVAVERLVTGEVTVRIHVDPATLFINRRWFYSLARATMTKRGFRRWRARRNAQRIRHG